MRRCVRESIKGGRDYEADVLLVGIAGSHRRGRSASWGEVGGAGSLWTLVSVCSMYLAVSPSFLLFFRF